MSLHIYPLPEPFSETFANDLHKISPTAASTALLIFRAVYDASDGKACFREDQLLSAVQLESGLDGVCVTRTSSDKTMQLAASALLHPDAITLVLSPLKRLQHTIVKGMSTLRGVRAVALNSDMRYDFAEWASIQNGERNIVVTSPEQYRKLIDEHPAKLSFLARICRLIVDDCHLSDIWGLALNSISDLRAELKTTPLLALTATAPPHVMSALPGVLALKEHPRRPTITRTHQVFAAYPIFGGLKNFDNLRMLIPPCDDIRPGSDGLLDIMRSTKRTIVFIDNVYHTTPAVYSLYNLIPASLRTKLYKLGLIKVYHSIMSAGYLEETCASFNTSSIDSLSTLDVTDDKARFCRILVVALDTSKGITIHDINEKMRDVEILIQYGLCESMEVLVERLARNLREDEVRGLSLLMYEPWAVTPSKKPSLEEMRTSRDVKDYVTTKECRRTFLARFAGSPTPNTLHPVPHSPCSVGHSESGIQFPAPPVHEPSKERPHAVTKKHRPTWQRAPMARAIRAWLHSEPRRSKAPSYASHVVLSDYDIDVLARAHPSKLTTEYALMQVLEETDEWRSLWAKDLLCVVKEFEASILLNTAEWEEEYWEETGMAKAKAVKNGDERESESDAESESEAESEFETESESEPE
ncbi:hypothetical protein FA95DRAFT_1555144 [Auriscalpium vulgare]|uniref:Uncharacterized protein n=1 Tax=Auriscalpium vulgare TaxID=40419 RepID=A0ACB8S402_9AGAM|nr:hypothetical protein FA95DRAFT_1555144 [Auriscalpium vulgare]